MAAPNECVPYKADGSALTCSAANALSGKRFVNVSADKLGGEQEDLPASGLTTDLANVYVIDYATEDAAAIGVTMRDVAQFGLVGVHCDPGMIVPVTSGAAINAGARVEVGANGKADPYNDGVAVGICLNGVDGADVDAEIMLFKG